MTDSVAGPLNGVKILDLTHVWAGPLAVRFLADLGAEVVRIEAPLSRGTQVFPSAPIGGWLSGEESSEPWNDNALFVKLMRNRRSVCVDLKQPEGRDLFLQLVAQADVVVENFSAKALSGLGLGFAELKQANDRIIYVSMPGFGGSGPLSDRVAFGPTVEAMSGFTSVFGYSEAEPRNTAIALMDPISGTHCVAAVLTALHRKQTQGDDFEATHVEMSLHEGGVGYNGPWLFDVQLGTSPVIQGNRHPDMAPHGVYPCSGPDQWVSIACADDAAWERLAEVLQVEQGLAFKTRDLAGRQQRHDEIDEVITAFTSVRRVDEVVSCLQAAGVACGKVNTTPDMVADPQAMARDFFVTYERFDRPMPGNPIKMAGLEPSQWQPCPRLGEHNAEVLADWLGIGEDEFHLLEGKGVLANKPPH